MHKHVCTYDVLSIHVCDVLSITCSGMPPLGVESALGRRGFRCYHTQSINQMGLESQLPHKTVNLLFNISLLYNKLTILWES